MLKRNRNMAEAVCVNAEMPAEEENLPKLFDSIWQTWEFLETTEEETNSYAVQSRAIRGLTAGEKAIKMINELRLFSFNESIDEVSTNELKYMLIPAFMGYFLQKRVTKDRQELVCKGKAYFTDFLRQCKSYQVIDIPGKIDEPIDDDSSVSTALGRGPPDVMRSVHDRNSKIEKYKEQKETESRLMELKAQVEKEHVDEEVKREYYLTLLKRWVHFSLDELDSLNCELTMLDMREQMQTAASFEDLKPKPRPAITRPFILTKDIIQKKVFGAGYPSLPTFTIEEFYEQKIKDGTFQPPSNTGAMNLNPTPEQEEEQAEKAAEEKEKKEEEDDEESLQKARDWDEYKDDHRRGWGNTYNKG